MTIHSCEGSYSKLHCCQPLGHAAVVQAPVTYAPAKAACFVERAAMMAAMGTVLDCALCFAVKAAMMAALEAMMAAQLRCRLAYLQCREHHYLGALVRRYDCHQ